MSFTKSACVCAASVISMLALTSAGCTSAARSSQVSSRLSSQAVLGMLAQRMAGSFSSQQQAGEDQEYRDIRLHMARIWLERTDAIWLYVEQAAATALDKPYRQRVYRLRDFSRGATDPYVFTSDVFVLPGDPLGYVGAWAEPAKLAGVTPEQLTLRDGCTLFLIEQPDGTFSGSTLGRGCPSDLRGAKYATSEAVIYADRLETWDRGFDEAGAQVWGATKGGYVFRRVAE